MRNAKTPEERVIRLLEKRWRERLPGGRVPLAMRAQLLKNPAFAERVESMRKHGCVVFPDLDFVPEIQRTPEGGTIDLMLAELGDNPNLYVCADCGYEVPRSRRRCAKCEHWRKTGEKSP